MKATKNTFVIFFLFSTFTHSLLGSENYVDMNHTIIMDGEEVIHPAHERYIMTKEEKKAYLKENNETSSSLIDDENCMADIKNLKTVPKSK